MLISIIIPCYNVEEYIKECLDSIFNQNVDESLFEVVLVNDGSTDRTQELVLPYTKSHHNCILLNQPNSGVSVARNTGMAVSKGDYLWFVDGDDWLESNAIQKSIELLRSDSTIDVITTPMAFRFPDSTRDYIDMYPDSDIIISGKQYLLSKYPLDAPRYVIRRKVLEKANIKYYPGIYHEDDLMAYQFLYLAQKIYVLSSFIYNYRQRDGSIMHTITIKNAYDILTIHRELIKYMNQYVHEEDKRWFRYTCLALFGPFFNFISVIPRSPEVVNLIKESKEYRQQECAKCIDGSTLRERVIIILYWHFPKVARFLRNLKIQVYLTFNGLLHK